MGKERTNKMSKTMKNIVSFSLILVLASIIAINTGVVKADSNETGTITVPSISRLGTKDLPSTATSIINTALGLLGLIALVIVLMGGFKWMTSAGNEEKVGEAKKLLGAGVIGLVIIFAAYAIASFIMSTVQSGTGIE